MADSDGRLVQRVRAGEREAFSVLVDRYRDMVYGLAYHLTADFEAARDLAQEGFVQAYLRLGTLRDPEKFAAWLRRIVVNLHRMQQRRRRESTASLEDEAHAVSQEHEPSEIEVVVRQALGRLRQPDRLALTLHYVNGYSHAEIGSFLGIRPETVKTRLARARQHLRREVMAMVEDTFESKKLPEEFTRETLQAAAARAEEHLKRGRVSAAIQEYDDILKVDENYVPALVGLGLAYKAAGAEDEALNTLRRVLELDPTNQAALGYMSHILGGHKRRLGELAALEEQQLKARPGAAPFLHVSLAHTYVALDKYEAAEAHIKAALEADPSNIDARVARGGMLAFQGRYHEAVAALEEVGPALAQDHSRWAGYEATRFQLAQVYCALGEYDKAMETARSTLIQDEPRHSHFDRFVERHLHALERCHHASGQLDSFVSVCRQIRKQMKQRDHADRLTWYVALFLESRLQRGQALAEFERLAAIPARCWRVAVPFDNREGRGMATAYPPEQGIALDDPDIGKDGRHIRWQRPMAEGTGFELNFMNQIQVNPFFFQWGLGYAVLRIVCPAKREAVFRFGAGGWSHLWLNGESVFLARTCVGVPDFDSVALKLKRGENNLLVKVGVHGASPSMRAEQYYWSLFSRITDADGEPMRDLRFPLGESPEGHGMT